MHKKLKTGYYTTADLTPPRAFQSAPVHETPDTKNYYNAAYGLKKSAPKPLFNLSNSGKIS